MSFRISQQRRRSAPALFRLWLSAVLVAVLTSAALGLVAWQQSRQVEALQTELQTLRSERQATEARWMALQSTATAMEERLATLEANDPAQQLAALEAAVETADGSRQLADLRASLAEIQTEVNDFQSALDALASRIEALEPANSKNLPPEARLVVSPQRQSHNLSCESSAAAMVAQYYGVSLSEADVLAALPSNDNPYLGFRGNVDGPTGSIQDYGVYAGPIMAILNSRGLRARPVEGGLDGIRRAIAHGHPVIAWVTYNCWPSTPTTVTIDGQAVTLVPYQHTVVVTGYNADGVWANDPWDGQEDFYPVADFERAMSYFGDTASSPAMAIEVAVP